MNNPEFSSWDPNARSEADKLREAVGEKGELPPLSPIERSQMEIDFEAFDRGITPQEVIAERLNRALGIGDQDD